MNAHKHYTASVDGRSIRVARPDCLSFVEKNTAKGPAGGGYLYWVVDPSDNYGQDCQTGKALADEYLGFLGEHPNNGNSTLLGCIVKDMVKRGTFSGVELAFLNRVNTNAMAFAAMTAGNFCYQP